MAAQDQVLPLCNEITGEVKLDSMKNSIEMLDLVFSVLDTATTARRKLLGLKQYDCQFFHYFMVFQQYVPDVRWNEEAQLDALRNGLSNKL